MDLKDKYFENKKILHKKENELKEIMSRELILKNQKKDKRTEIKKIDSEQNKIIKTIIFQCEITNNELPEFVKKHPIFLKNK